MVLSFSCRWNKPNAEQYALQWQDKPLYVTERVSYPNHSHTCGCYAEVAGG